MYMSVYVSVRVHVHVCRYTQGCACADMGVCTTYVYACVIYVGMHIGACVYLLGWATGRC